MKNTDNNGMLSPLDLRLNKVRRKKEIIRWLERLVLLSVIIIVLLKWVFGIAVIYGDSMTPALHEGDIVLFYRLEKNYKRNDIVLIKKDEQGDYVKRIVAAEGDTLEINEQSRSLVINGEVVAEPYIYEETLPKSSYYYPVTLEKEEYFVLGDHRENSLDSRDYGPIKQEQLDGVVLAVLRLGR